MFLFASLHENWQSYCPEKPLTLLFDCAACHLHSTVRSLAKTLGLQVLVVPAGATGTLRCEIRRQWTQTKSEAAEGVVSREAWLRVMATAVETVLSHRDWQRAFERNWSDQAAELHIVAYIESLAMG